MGHSKKDECQKHVPLSFSPSTHTLHWTRALPSATMISDLCTHTERGGTGGNGMHMKERRDGLTFVPSVPVLCVVLNYHRPLVGCPVDTTCIDWGWVGWVLPHEQCLFILSFLLSAVVSMGCVDCRDCGAQ